VKSLVGRYDNLWINTDGTHTLLNDEKLEIIGQYKNREESPDRIAEDYNIVPNTIWSRLRGWGAEMESKTHKH
jgi:transposase-like protein